jgi:hypothetical protein
MQYRAYGSASSRTCEIGFWHCSQVPNVPSSIRASAALASAITSSSGPSNSRASSSSAARLPMSASWTKLPSVVSAPSGRRASLRNPATFPDNRSISAWSRCRYACRSRLVMTTSCGWSRAGS